MVHAGLRRRVLPRFRLWIPSGRVAFRCPRSDLGGCGSASLVDLATSAAADVSDSLTIGGIPIPFRSPILLAVLAIHVAAGAGAVVSGALAMLSTKGPGRHPRFGRLYFWCLVAVTMTMAFLSIARWREDYHLFVIGAFAAASALLGLTRVRRTPRQLRTHLISFGASYILLLTAFYVDNGKNLPLWSRLPRISYWLLPSAIGVPLIIRALRGHPLLRRQASRRALHRL